MTVNNDIYLWVIRDFHGDEDINRSLGCDVV